MKCVSINLSMIIYVVTDFIWHLSKIIYLLLSAAYTGSSETTEGGRGQVLGKISIKTFVTSNEILNTWLEEFAICWIEVCIHLY